VDYPGINQAEHEIIVSQGDIFICNLPQHCYYEGVDRRNKIVLIIMILTTVMRCVTNDKHGNQNLLTDALP